MSKRSGSEEPSRIKQKCYAVVPSNKPGSAGRVATLKRMLEEAVPQYLQEWEIDEKGASGSIKTEMYNHIRDDDLMIADLHGADANVYYQVGIRHVVGKPVILLIEKREDARRVINDFNKITINVAKDYPGSRDAIKKVVKSIFEGKSPKQAPILGTQQEKLISEFFDTANKKLTAQIDDLQKLRRDIEDTIRKPLRGIDQIFAQIYMMLQSAHVGGNLWFVGMTLGLGPPHLYREKPQSGGPSNGEQVWVDPDEGFPPAFESLPALIGERGASVAASWDRNPPEITSLNRLFIVIRERLRSIVEKAPKCRILCLTPEEKTLKSGFLSKLALRSTYSRLTEPEGRLALVAEEIIKAHLYISSSIASDSLGPAPAERLIKYVESIPLQILIVELPDESSPSAPLRKACLVFHVGTGNIATSVLDVAGEMGFYSEVASVVEVFESMTESLCDAAPRKGG